MGAIVIGALAAIAVATAVVGWLLPRHHTAARTRTYAAPPDRVFAAIADVGRYAEWRSDVKAVEVLADDGHGLRFREKGAHGRILYRFEVSDAPRRVVARIADPSLPFGGTWTYELAPVREGTSVTITERGEVFNPVFRVMQTLFFSPASTIETYLGDLSLRLHTH